MKITFSITFENEDSSDMELQFSIEDVSPFFVYGMDGRGGVNVCKFKLCTENSGIENLMQDVP